MTNPSSFKEKASDSMKEGTELIARATLFQDGTSVRGKLPVPLVKALKAKGGDILTFERRADGAIVVRKSTAAERSAGSASAKRGRKR
jgi:hypothetical protein